MQAFAARLRHRLAAGDSGGATARSTIRAVGAASVRPEVAAAAHAAAAV